MTDAARTLQRRVLEHIRTAQLWTEGQSVLVAVSGGVDSTVLLHLLHRTQGAHGGRLRVLTVDHGLREASSAEAESVAQVSDSLGLPCEIVRLDLQGGPNLYERARDARRAAMVARGTDRIATGHHEGDQAETVLYHLLRGSGMRGLKGMQARLGAWVRPLLREPRSVLEAWAHSENISWVEDPSNATSQRGRIREILPQLNELHGGAGRALARSSRLLAREDDYLEIMVDQVWGEVTVPGGLDRMLLMGLHPALQLRLLRRLIADGRVRADPLEAVVGGALISSGQLDLGYGNSLVCSGGVLRVEKP
jgi:tRNA(Ile)-lysidine synthase